MVNHLFKLAQEKVGLGAMTIAVGLVSTIIFLPSAESFKKGCCQLQAKVCTQSTFG